MGIRKIFIPFFLLALAAVQAFGEDGELDTVGRLGIGTAYGKLATTEQATNAELVSGTGLVLNPALDLAIDSSWLLTLESEHRLLDYQAPASAFLLKDPAMTSSITGGFHLMTSVFELGVLAGIGQSTFVSAPPDTSYISTQTLLLPYAGGRLAYNGRWDKDFYFRLEALYLHELGADSTRTDFRVAGASRIMVNTHWGFYSWAPWLRFTAGIALQNADTSIGAQNSTILTFGLSIGNLWGQRTRSAR